MDTPDAYLFHGSLVSTRRILYTPSLFARENLLYLQETGSLKAAKPHTSERRGLSSFLFFVVRSGSGELSYEGTARHLSAGDCIFLDCRKPYSHTTSDDLWELAWAHFNGPTLPGIYTKYRERGGAPVFRPEELAPFDASLLALYQLASSDDYIRDMRISAELSHLLCLVMAQSWHPENKTAGKGTKTDAAQKVRAYLDAHYQEKITLDDLAARYFINKYYLARIFRDRYGTTIGNYLLQLRISEAKRLLRFTDLTVEAIGAKVGIPDASYLSRVFTRVEGVSPSVYRKSW